ncbi:LysR family transcriptional regulator [Siminovitchia fortis]|uniref:LysR family transcriptional regulator n=1 Tax=Siminovitchia fortis TaxID=254758 RepID=A0A443IXP0_9BACI|nr:LysR family transcriptional regulator [Siminovitchia fortis]RWR12859.1 LysR family transcriptional regulator [Siminovitchia fortis]WHY80485.1 LysR family transcriptional regulator [Siminovitchia fortis]
MDTNRLKYFVAVVEENGITAAAKKLNISQPSLSIMIKKLEQELDALLFTRENKTMILTDVGELLYKRSKNILVSMNDMVTELNEAKKGLRGEIKIGCSTAANLIIIPNIVENLQKAAPHVSIRVIEGDTKYICEQMVSHQLDAAIVRTTFTQDIFDTYSIITEPVVACMHKEHPLAQKEHLTLKDFADENFLLNTTTTGSGLSDYVIKKCKEAGFTPNVKYWGSQGLPMAILASKGVGVTFLPESFKYLPFCGGLPVFRKIDSPELTTSLELITLKGRFRSKATDMFLQQVVELTKKFGSGDDLPDIHEQGKPLQLVEK